MEMYRQASCLPLRLLGKQFSDAPVNSTRGQESLAQAQEHTHTPPPPQLLTKALLVLDDVAHAHWLSVKDCRIELLVITAGKWFSQYF